MFSNSLKKFTLLKKICIVFCLVLSITAYGYAFNLSPRANYILREPRLQSELPKVRSSYFGFTLVLRTNSIIVGAPRAQSSLEKQRKVNETGAIYKCSLQTGQCAPFVFDDIGNTLIENSEYTYDSEKKDNQWLGASMDGGSKDTDRLVVCAPRRLANLKTDYLVHGICFWTSDTVGDRPLNVMKISPLRLKGNQVKESSGRKYFYHMFGEQGISVHITENNEEIIIGAPGIHTWKGSIIRYRAKLEVDVGGLSRRDNRANMIRQKRAAMEYTSEIPNPDLWNQNNDSYFGYSVTSNFFTENGMNKILYVATAPQANEQSGEAYLFDIVKSKFGELTIKKYHVFHGSQFGEYFGYSVISEDVNNDGLPDVIISAPQYAVGMNYEKGAVYIFMNKGNLDFDSGKILIGKSNKPGRFGTTLSKLGDINHDGFNDIAISAPFEDNGVVYIYLGNEKGVREKPSQILRAPEISTIYKQFMFGHGLSKGVDINRNGFNDIAIGAPNAEAVFVYSAYPVVKIVASVTSPSRAINIDQSKFQIRACYQLETTSTQFTGQAISVKITADTQVKRVKFITSGSNEVSFDDIATFNSQCRLLDAIVRYSLPDIFKPIELEMSYDLVNKVPDSEKFCETCVAVDPLDPTSVSQKIVFSTGCKTDICVADLQLTSSGIKSPYIIGSTRTISIQYFITNEGETAYLPQINFTSSNQMPFAKIPSSCIQENFSLLCDLNQGRPMNKGSRDSLTIVFDTTDIEGESMVITAKVFSTGNELTADDNEAIDIVNLAEFSEIESAGHPITPPLNLEDNIQVATITNNFEIRNSGPSKVSQMDIVISVPISYLIPKSDNRIPLIDFSNITVNATHNKKPLHVEFYQNNSMLIQNAMEFSSTPTSIVSNLQVDTSDGAFVKYPLEEDNVDELLRSSRHVLARRRRAVEAQVTEAEYARISQKTVTTQFSDDLVGSFPINRTILFNCNNPEETLCVQAIMRVYNFQSGDSSISISLQFNIDLKEVNKILLEPKEFFVVTTSLNISKIGDEEGKTFILKKTDPHNIISKHQLYSTPIWIYIVSILGGLLLLVLITYGLYKLGFFKRQEKEELQKLCRESQRQEVETEDEE